MYHVLFSNQAILFVGNPRRLLSVSILRTICHDITSTPLTTACYVGTRT